MYDITDLMNRAMAARSSDIHVAPGTPARIRVDGKLQFIDDVVLTPNDCHILNMQLVGEQRYKEKFATNEEIDAGVTVSGRRCRVHIYKHQGNPALALRVLSDKIPAIEDLGLPQVVQTFPSLQRGIVVVTGETGAGKSTTLASILNRVNQLHYKHIVTLEDPIEYVYHEDRCMISQREVGPDTASFSEGLRASLRQDPDVILVGEMRDPDTIETALTAAETGHLVFGTLHTNSAPETINRIIDVFPEGRQDQIRMQLSTTIQAIMCQQLLPRAGGVGRVAAVEVMIATPAIRNLIRENKTPQIANAQATDAHLGSVTMDNALIQLAMRKAVTRDTAIEAAIDREYVKKGINNQGRMMGV